MKKLIRLTESDLHNIVVESIKKILKEDTLGNNWHENDQESVFNNYEPFEYQKERYEAEDEFRNQYDWSTQGEEPFDPTDYEDPDAYKDDYAYGRDWSPSDGDLYRGM